MSLESILTIVAFVIGMICLLPGYGFASRYINRRRHVTRRAIVFVIWLLSFSVIAFLIPFALSYGQNVESSNLIIDLLLWGMFPLVAISILFYSIDLNAHHPGNARIAGAACMAVPILPLAYVLLSGVVMHAFGIHLK